LQILDAMRTFGPLTRKDVAALGVSAKSVCGILTELERKGRIVVDPVARPLRYSLVRGLERLAEYEDARQGL
jgi:predicted transcriptional regulator of viral defense system